MNDMVASTQVADATSATDTPDVQSAPVQQSATDPESTASPTPESTTDAPKTDKPSKKPVPESIKNGDGPKWYQDRLSHYAAQHRESKAELERMRQHLAQFQAEMGQKKGQRDPNAPPQQEDFDRYDDFVKANAKWEARQEFTRLQQEREQQEAQLSYQRSIQEFDAHAMKAAMQYENPEAVFAAMKDDSIPISPAMGQAILYLADQGPEVVLHLSQNRQEATRLFNMPPAQAGIEIMRIAHKLNQASAAPSAPTHAMPSQVRPTAVPQIRGSAPGSDLDDMPNDKDDMATWMRKETNRMRKRFGPNVRVYGT